MDLGINMELGSKKVEGRMKLAFLSKTKVDVDFFLHPCSYLNNGQDINRHLYLLFLYLVSEDISLLLISKSCWGWVPVWWCQPPQSLFLKTLILKAPEVLLYWVKVFWNTTQVFNRCITSNFYSKNGVAPWTIELMCKMFSMCFTDKDYWIANAFLVLIGWSLILTAFLRCYQNYK